jgi:hypothetical protein
MMHFSKAFLSRQNARQNEILITIVNTMTPEAESALFFVCAQRYCTNKTSVVVSNVFFTMT